MKTQHAQQNQNSLSRFMNQIYGSRYSKNNNYSLRAFARDLEVSVGNLSKVLSGQRGFSRETLEKISEKLGLSKSEQALLKTLSEKDFSRSKRLRDQAQKSLTQKAISNIEIKPEDYQFISEWYHFAILAFLDSDDARSNIQKISEVLGLREIIVEAAIEKLIELKVIKKTGRGYSCTGQLFVDPKGIPSTAVKSFHQQVLKHAEQALFFQNLGEREFLSSFFSIDQKKIDAAKEKIRRFRLEFEQEFGLSEQQGNPAVYGFAIQFFKVSKK